MRDPVGGVSGHRRGVGKIGVWRAALYGSGSLVKLARKLAAADPRSTWPKLAVLITRLSFLSAGREAQARSARLEHERVSARGRRTWRSLVRRRPRCDQIPRRARSTGRSGSRTFARSAAARGRGDRIRWDGSVGRRRPGTDLLRESHRIRRRRSGYQTARASARRWAQPSIMLRSQQSRGRDSVRYADSVGRFAFCSPVTAQRGRRDRQTRE